MTYTKWVMTDEYISFNFPPHFHTFFFKKMGGMNVKVKLMFDLSFILNVFSSVQNE